MAILILNSTTSPVTTQGQLEFNTDKQTLVVGNGADEIAISTNGSNTFIGNQSITGSISVTGTITANEFHVTYVTASAAFSSGSTKFGDDINDIHQFTGSFSVLGTINLPTVASTIGTTENKILVADNDGNIKYRTDFALQGATGTQGAQGIQGEIGLQGTTGTQGLTGTQGSTGEQGIQGLQGTTGTQGQTGTQGTTGTQGAQGIQGEQGIQGTQGTQGIQGIQGEIGTQGTTGVSDRYASTSSTSHDITTGSKTFTIATGLSWTSGLTTIIGVTDDGTKYMTATVMSYNSGTGEFVVDVTSVVGSGTGITTWQINSPGATGAQGAQGTTGPQGAQGTTGTQGAQGTQGIAGSIEALPAGTVSGSSQVLGATGIVSSSQQISDYSVFLEINGDNVVSGSSQLTSSYDERYVLSGSITQTTWDNIASKPEGIVSSSIQVLGNTGILSSSTENFTEFSTSVDLSFDNLNGFSSSINTTIKTKLDIENVISGSSQITLLLPTGAVSGSSQINIYDVENFATFNDAIMSDINGKEEIASATHSLVSGSSQIDVTQTQKYSTLATTGSNTFVGTQIVSASVYVTGDLIVQGSSSLQNITASAVSIGTNIVYLNTDTPAIRFAGLSVFDSGSTGATGSLLYDSENERWVYQKSSGSAYSGGMLISGPRNTSGLGSEVGMTNNRLAMGIGGDHISSSQVYVDNDVVAIPGNLQVTGSQTLESFTILENVGQSLNFANDDAASTGGVPLYGLYRNGNFIMIRLT